MSVFLPRRVQAIDLESERHPVDLLPSSFAPYEGRRLVLARAGVQPIALLDLRDGQRPHEIELGPELDRALAIAAATKSDDAARPSVAVVIATRDRPAQLERCLTALGHLSETPDRIVVVDNAPTSADTAAVVERVGRQTVVSIDYVVEPRPGLGRAHNAAIGFVAEDIIAFIDDDVVVDRYWLRQLTAGFARSRVGATTGAILPLRIETWPQAWVQSTVSYTEGFEPRNFSLNSEQSDPLFPLTAGRMGSGANMAFRRDVLDQIGWFDEALGAGTASKGGDDLRSFYAVVRAGHVVRYQPSAIVFHDHNDTAQAILRQCHGYGAGLTAFLTSVVLDEPKEFVRLLRGAIPATARARDIVRPRGGTAFPGEARRTIAQLTGMVSGPIRYARSRIDVRLRQR